MYVPKSLAPTERPVYYKTLQANHNVSVGVELRRMDNTVLRTLDGFFMDGQVNVDAKTPTGRSLTMSLLDPDRDLLLVGPPMASWTGCWHVEYRTRVPILGRWVSSPVFVGPIMAAPRQGSIVQITCASKAQLGLHGIRDPFTIKKGNKRTDAIRWIMHDLTGEDPAHMDLPDLPTKLVHDEHLVRESYPWTVARKIAQSMSRHLHYDPAGVLRMPTLDADAAPVWTFEVGNFLMGVPTVEVDMKDLVNAVAVFGRDGTEPLATAILKDTNRYSPQAPRPPLTPRAYFWRRDHEPARQSKEEAQKLADDMLARAVTEHQNITFNTMVFPGLDEDDPIKLNAANVLATARASQFSIPLNVDSGDFMSIGENRRVSLNHLADKAG